MWVTSSASSTPLSLRSGPDCTAVPPSAQCAPIGSATSRTTIFGGGFGGGSLHTMVRFVTSASSSTPLRFASRPVLTTEPPAGHSAALAGSVRTPSTGAGGSSLRTPLSPQAADPSATSAPSAKQLYNIDFAPTPSTARGWRRQHIPCLLYTSDAADERSSVDLGGRRIIKKKKH